MLSEQELREIEERNNQAKGENCPECEGFGHIEVYPPHSAEAYTGTGEPTWDTIPCPICEDVPALLAEVRRQREELERYRWRKVREEVPPASGNYLVLINHPSGAKWYEVARWHSTIQEWTTPMVVAWMPIPPMPEEG